jgi:Mn-dependent DtxR family transcriptional regulator
MTGDNNTAMLGSLKARILINLLHVHPNSYGITHLADVLFVAKSSVSRAVDWFVSSGFVERVQGRKIKLTEAGLTWATKLNQRRDQAKIWLENSGVPQRDAEDDALVVATSFSKSSIDVIERAVCVARLTQKFATRKSVNGTEFCSALQDGEHPFSCTFYRCQYAAGIGIEPSMANDGIEQQGTLAIKNGKGSVVLTAKPLDHVSALGGMIVHGSISGMQYFDGRKFKATGKEGNIFRFPAETLTFFVVGGGRFFQGSTILKMSCSVGANHMPDSEAILTLFF